MYNVTKPAQLPKEGRRVIIRETPFVIPVADPKEQAEPYIVAVKANAPFEYCHLGGICFQKYVMPEAATLTSNSNEHFFPRLVSIMLTKRQAEAIMAEAAKREIYVPRIRNPKYALADNNSDEPSHFKGGYFKINEWLIVEPEATYDAKKYPSADDDWQTLSPVATSEDIKGQLLEEQRQPSLTAKAKK